MRENRSCSTEVFAAMGRGYGSLVNTAAMLTGVLMVAFASAMVVAMLLERRRVRELTRDPSRVPADLRRRVRAGATRRRRPEEER